MSGTTARDRAADLAALGARGEITPAGVREVVEAARFDPDPTVRACALAALARGAPGPIAAQTWRRSAVDPHPAVRRRAAQLAGEARSTASCGVESVSADSARVLLGLIGDTDPLVAEAAAFAAGERAWPEPSRGLVVGALAAAVTAHPDPLVREAAVAALGALGDVRGLDAVLVACSDRPAIRRRAVLALAPFEGEAVQGALHRALDDRDLQVRQAAEDLLEPQGAATTRKPSRLGVAPPTGRRGEPGPARTRTEGDP